MPQNLTYPGIYIEEVENPVRTIVAASTSVTGFIGRAKKGSVDKATKIFSFSAFENIFGGLWYDAPMSYSVYQYFVNDGKEVVIVRVAEGEDTAETVFVGSIELVALNAGIWANGLKVKISNVDGLKFNLQVIDDSNLAIDPTADPIILEEILNIELDPAGKRHIESVLEAESKYLRLKNGLDTSALSIPNQDDEGTLAGGSDGNIITQTQINGDNGDTGNPKEGIHAFDDEKSINIMVVPPFGPNNEMNSDTYDLVAKYCLKRRAMLIVDPPTTWTSRAAANTGMNNTEAITPHTNAAIFFPRIRAADPLKGGLIREFTPSGVIAGIFARTDQESGVWISPAGINASIRGIAELRVNLSDNDIGVLNPSGLNCLKQIPVIGNVVWGARTTMGADALANQWKYTAVRRTALFIEQTLVQNLNWVLFKGNDEKLWSQIRMAVKSFMHSLFRQGAFQGTSPKEGYFVKCDNETTLQDDINKGIVNIIVGFAPLKPAEFVVIKIQQIVNPGGD